jgi:hypothetical protein
MGKYWKAIIAALAPTVAAIEAAVNDTAPGDPLITTAERWRIVAAALIALGVFAKANTTTGA